MKEIELTGSHLTLDDLVCIAAENAKVKIAHQVQENVNQSWQYVNQLVKEQRIVYGITTGFGQFSNISISNEQIEELQANLIRSHACGVGDDFEKKIVRAIMVLRVNALVKGYSGIRLSTCQLLVDMLNVGIHPRIPEKGSLGSSGDLAPLSHMVLTMMGESECEYQGKIIPSAQALDLCNLAPVTLQAKEGLALINGTQVLTAVGAIALWESLEIMKIADIAAAMTFEALRGVRDVFDPKVHQVRPHIGQAKCARNLTRLTADSHLTTRQGEVKLQDSYSLRCLPQIHGASKEAIEYVLNKVNIEMNAATDNPLIFVHEKQVISCGNFHGQPMALAFDFLAIALAELANSSERRIERLVNPSLSELPPFLTEYGGSNSGFMIMQYTAAALVSENKILAHPASVDSIPSSGNQEDHVSMGTIAARKAYEVLKNTKNVLAIELLAAAQGLDFNATKRLGIGTKAAYSTIRLVVDHLDKDRFMQPDILDVVQLIDNQAIVNAVVKAIGPLE